MPLTSGARLGTYEILAPLGAGGMGEVYRARDTRLGRDVALKVLPADVSADAGRLARFEREARAVAALNHPNIVMLHSIEDVDGVRFLTMELVEGETLGNLITPGGLALPRLLDLAIPLTDALVAAHERGVVHRDLKPGNVMVSREGRVKVLDFGLAKRTGGEASGAGETVGTAPLSGPGHAMGTIPYMAPEQLRGEAVDARADLFALGIMLYELASGRRPFHGESAAEVTSAILRDTPAPLAHTRSGLPVDLERIVSRCLEKNPRERVQSALDVSNELRRLRKALEGRASGKPAVEKVATIAVLPFVNRSASADDEYFSDGLADELLGVLSKIKGLRVSARASAFQFKGKGAPLVEIGKVLNVETVLDGSVRKAGNRIRVSVQLVKVADGYHLWSETYDRTLDDIFAVQDDIAQSVVKELRTTLLGAEADSDASGEAKAEVAQAAKGRGTDPEAHRLYLLARHLVERRNPEDHARAAGYLRQALALDPDSAMIWAELGRVYQEEAGYGWVPTAQGVPRAREAVERALALEPDLAEGHVQLAWIQAAFDREWKAAQASSARALELVPGSSTALRGAGRLAAFVGSLEEAVVLLRRALERDPLGAAIHDSLGTMLYFQGQLSEAEAAHRRALELAPQRILTHASLAMVLLAQDRFDDARAEALREPDELLRSWVLGIVHQRTGNRAESDAALKMLVEKGAGSYAYQIAEVYAVRGEADAAFEWLERALAQGDGGIPYARRAPQLRGLHGDPRWKTFMRKLGFED